ncbi:MAG: glycosyltransferase family 4 protein [Candidatus Levybacteria bacterium]|nr:glycosyltransferase family 4 protein [Candidatus Levybacteria bacterium]
MRILIFNWRDIKNPAGGGAEILTHEMAKRWVLSGHTVHQFSSRFPDSKKQEIIDGVTFIRQGKWWTVHFYAFFYYIKNKNLFDVIVDEVHWFPFFAAVYAPRKTIALTCEVANKLIFRIFAYPLALGFLLIEKIYLFLYKKVPTMVISPSTRDDLVANNHIKENIVVLPMGLTVPKNIKPSNKESIPTIISVGRLNKQKGTLDTIEAFGLVHKKISNSVLWLVGSGEKTFMREVNLRIKTLGLENAVKVWGFVSEKEKFTLLSKAHILISASVQEGWGLTIPEAGLMSTPSVVYNIAGFRDIIVQRKTGVLVDTNPKDLAKEVVQLLENKTTYEIMQNKSLKHAQGYSWDATAAESIKFIKRNSTI